MKFKRILALLLATLLLAGALTACGETAEEPTPGTGISAPTDEVTETEAATLATDSLPDDLDYEGTKITFISRYLEGWTSGEIAVEGLISEPVNDAIYERNRAVEERLHVEIVSIEDNTTDPYPVVNKVENSVKAGLKEYDVLAAAC